VGLELIARQTGISDNSGEQVVEIMRDAAGQQPNAFQLFSLAETFLRLFANTRHFEVGGDASQQFAGGEWLNKVVVGARFEAFNLGFLTGAGREKNNRHRAGAIVGAQAFE
jgi:hypothetical protein